MDASMLLPISSSGVYVQFHAKCDRNQMIIVDASMMVNAFLIKCLHLSHRWSIVLLKPGAR